MNVRISLIGLLFAVGIVSGAHAEEEPSATDKGETENEQLSEKPTNPHPAKTVEFVKDIKPILRDKCSHCHNAKTLPKQVSFESRKLAFAPNYLGQLYFNPGHPEESLILKALTHPLFHEKKMPMVGPAPTEEELELLKQWIREGAEWPKGPRGRIRPPFHAQE